ncbi:NAD(P)/FAD-dependent oxidoreductase [Akkermansiaceae bacterium]|nr:NAD(P)/FAD-dependent oxidoreductase [Akkermansiaceae bacterium]
MATSFQTRYDAVIIGSGHNGMVAACYLAQAGLSVLVLERNAEIGGATRSERVFKGMDARLSAYSYLVSLFPRKILDDLGIAFGSKRRATASWTPSLAGGGFRELLLRNGEGAEAWNRDAFAALTGGDGDYRGYLRLQEMQAELARVLWPSMLEPLVSRDAMRSRLKGAGLEAWQAIIEEPLGKLIEELISDDLVRGLVFTDARIGVAGFPHDPSLLQNRCFLYHIIGGGTGEWQVPVGGMGALIGGLRDAALATGKVTVAAGARATRIDPGAKLSVVAFETEDGGVEVDARHVLCNASADVLAGLTGTAAAGDDVEGTAFKVNMLLKRLPKLRDSVHAPEEAFAGTVHIDEGYAQMMASHAQSAAGILPARPPGEIYCHTLTDPSILSEDLARKGYHTLTLFGLDMPYSLFRDNNAAMRAEALRRYIAGVDQFLAEPLESCLAEDADGRPCIEAMSAVDLEEKIHLPKGNIFHGDLTWPFVGEEAEAELWGVETAHPNVFLCGSSAVRGGAVSGIPGHSAAMKVLGKGASI